MVDYLSSNVNCVSDDAGCNASPVADYIIQGTLGIVAPIGNETYSIGDPIQIKWTKMGSIGNLTLDYSTDNGGTWVTPAIDGNASPGVDAPTENTYNGWTAPAKVSELFKVRIRTNTAPAGAELETISPASFYVRPTLTSFSTPVDATRWYASDTNRTIRWNGVTGVKNDASYPLVIVEYSVDGSLYTGNTIQDNYQFTATPQNATWATLPDVKSKNVKVKVTFKDFASRNIESEPFDVFPILQVDAPTLDQQFTVGTTYDNLIKWSQIQGTGVDEVNIYYAQDGVNWDPTPINGGTPVAVGQGATGYTWTIPNAISDLVKIKVQDAELGFDAVNAMSPKFTIRGGITFDAPDNGENRAADTAVDIAWTYTGAMVNFDIYYSIVAGAGTFPGDYVQIADNVAAATACSGGSCSYTWPADENSNTDAVLNTASILVNNNTAPSNLIYVSAEGTEFKRGASLNNLTVFNGPFIPVGSTTSEIQWTKLTGLVTTTQMKIDYTNNAQGGPPTWNELTPGTDNDGSFIWPTVPGTLNDLNADVKLRITQVNPDNSAVTVISTETFCIRAVIDVTAPTGSGSESWGLLEDHDIKFTKKGALQTVNIYYAPDGTNYEANPINTAGPIDISALADNVEYTWTWNDIPANTPLSTAGFNSKIKVKAQTPDPQRINNAQGISNGGFQIRGSVNSVTPSGDTTNILVGDQVDIRWVPTGAILKYKVEYSHVMTGGPTWVEITPTGGVDGDDAGGGAKKWTWNPVLDTISNNVLFRVSDYNNSNANSVSPVANYIRGKLSIPSPIVTDVWTVGNTPTPSIQWDKTGSIGDLKIEYSTTGTFTAQDYTDGNVYTIESAYFSGNNGVSNYTWVAGIIGANRKISDTSKIRMTNLSAPAGTELEALSAQFKIRSNFTSLDNPTALTLWYATDTDAGQTIEWVSKSGTKSGNVVPTCVVEYSTNGEDYFTVPGGNAVACGQGGRSLLWTPMADLRSATVRVRISYNDYTSINTDLLGAPAQFTVRPKVVVTPTPDGNTNLLVGQTYSNLIKWTYSGTTTNRKVEVRYYPGDGVIATDIPAANGATGVTWTNVPDVIGTNVTVKVIDMDFNASQGESPQFRVAGNVVLTAPVLNQKIVASSTTNTISWNFWGSNRTVNVYYDPDDTADDWTLIGSKDQTGGGASGSSSLNWDLSVTPVTLVGNRYRIRLEVQDPDSGLKTVSVSPLFKVIAAVSVTSPVNGEVVYSEDPNTQVTWNKTAGTGLYKWHVYYTNNSESAPPTWIRVTDANGVGGALSAFDWNPIPRAYADLVSTDQRVRIVQFYDTTPATDLDNFTAAEVGAIAIGTGSQIKIKAKLAVTRPTNNISWNANTVERIKWTKMGDLHSVDVYYSPLGDFTDEIKINTTAVNVADGCEPGCKDGSDYYFDWNIIGSTPLTAGYAGRIRVKAVDPGSQTTVIGTQSPGRVEVKGSLTMDAPTGVGVALRYGGPIYKIQWTPYGAIQNVKLHYSTNGGEESGGTYPDPQNLIWTGSAVDGQAGCTPVPCYQWSISDKIGNQVRVRVQDAANDTVKAESSDNIEIYGSLALDWPNDTVTHVFVGTHYDVKWTPTGTYPGSYRQLVTFDFDKSGSGGFGDPGVLEAVPPTASNTADGAQGTYDWLVPDEISGQVKFRVRVKDSPTEVAAMTGGTFKIVGKITQITSPSDGVPWYAGDTNRQIVWSATGTVTNVRIEFYDGTGWRDVVADSGGHVNGANSFDWTSGIPADVKTNGSQIRITDVNYPETTFTTPYTFKILPKLRVDAPVLDQQLTVQGTYDNLIKWTQTQGTGVSSVNIYYAADGTNYEVDPINGGTPVAVGVGAMGYTWTIPNAISSLVKIKVQDAAPGYEAVNAVSNKFTIRGGIVFQVPQNGVNKTADTGMDISWQYTGSIVNFDVYYSVTAGAGVFPDDYVQIADNVATATYCGGGACSYTWPAGGTNDDMVLNTASILVNNNELTNSLTYVSSEGTEFKRGALVSNLLPSNGQVVTAGTDYEITWVKDKGPSSNTKMKLEYSNNYSGARTWNPVLDSSGDPLNAVGNTGAAIWRVPKAYEDLQADLRLRITQSDPDNTAVQTLGAGSAFVIKAPITVVFPKGDQSEAERWGLADINREVIFKKTGAIKKVIIMYSAAGDFTDEVDISGLVDISAQPDDTNIVWQWPIIPVDANLTSGFSGKMKVKADDPQQQRGISVGISAGGFQLSGSINNVTPTNATDLVVGGFKQIRWEPLGSFLKFKVEYSYVMSGQPSWIEITPAGGVDGIADGIGRTWTWGPSVGPLIIPDTISNKVLFRVSDYNNLNTYRDSNYTNPTFYNIIKGTLDLQTPDDSPQTFYIGDQIPISWTKLGTIGNLLIQHTAKGDSSDLVTIDPSFPSGNDGTNFLNPVWTTSTSLKVSEDYRIKVSNVGAPAGTELSDTSTATFGLRPKITGITSPLLSGLSLWYVGEQRTITFSATSSTKPNGSLPKVQFQYLVQGGSWTDLVYETGHPQAGQPVKFDCANGVNNFLWADGVADEFSETVKIKIFFEEYPNDTNASMESANFKIRPEITLDPALDQNIRPLAFSNNPNFVKWTYTGSQLESSSVNVRYDLFNGTGVDLIPDTADDFAGVIANGVSVTAGAAGVAWNNVPDVNNAVKIRVYDTTNPIVRDDTPAFHIVAGLGVTAPINGVTWLAKSTTNNISWTFNGTVINFKIYYDSNEGKGADGISGNADDYNYNTPIGTKSQVVPISQGSMTWNWNPMPDTVTNKGVIKVTDADDEEFVSAVGTMFKIGAQFDITDPESGHTAYAEESYDILWNNFSINGVNAVSLYYTNDPYAAEVVWTPITTSAQNTGSFEWNPVPSALADLANKNRVRIAQYDPLNETGTYVASEGDFSIKGKLVVTVPSNDEWAVGAPHRVKFKKKGALQSANVYYSYDGTEGNYTLSPVNTTPLNISGAPNDGATGEYWYDWTPDAALTLTTGKTGTLKVKVVTPGTQVSVAGISGGFQLKGGISDVLPSGASDLEVTGNKQISWTTSGLIAKYKVFYRCTGAGCDSSGNWIEISPVDGVNTSPWTWMNIPDEISNDIDFKVEDFNNSNVSGESAVNNIIKGKLDMTAPNATVVKYIGNTIPITWTKAGSIGLLKIEYSAKGDFSDPVEITGGIDPNELAYGPTEWTAPFKVSENYKVRISTTQAPAGAELTDQSTSVFMVRPKVTGITSPLVSGTSVWNVGTQQSITWNVTTAQKADTSNGLWPKVMLQYYDSNGDLWKDIPNSSSPAEVDCDNATKTYTWISVADENDEASKIRVYFKDYPGDMTAGRDSATFSIRPVITLDPSINTNLRIIAFSNDNPVAFTYTGTKLTTVNVLYDLNNANTFAGTIHAGLSVSNNAGSTEWDNVPDINGSVKIRVIDTVNPNVKIDSGSFKIIGGLTLTKPVSPASWKAKSTTNDIEWSFNGTIANVKIYYDLNEGLGVDGVASSGDEWDTNTPITTVAQSGTGSVMTYRWNPMPGKVTNKGVIKITDANNETDVYSVGGTQQKTLPLAAAQLFKIGAPFDITDPENGHTAYSEEEYTILWNNYLVTGVTKVALYYTNNSGDPSPTWNLITNNTQNTGNYIWNPVPRALADLNNTNQIRITQYEPLNEAGTAIESEGDFAILGALTVTNPSVGNESWGVNVPQRIKFTKKGNLQGADLWYSYDGAANHYVKITGTPVNIADGCEPGCKDGADYFYDWPLNPGTTALTNGFTGRIKAKAVTPNTQTAVEGLSSVFEVKGTVTLIAPTGHEVDPDTLAMEVGSVYTIRWQKFGAVDNVEIHFSTNGGVSYPDGDFPAGNRIYSGPSNINPQGADYTFPWDVPDRIGNNVMIRIRHRENTNVKNDPDLVKAFRIKGKLALTQPENAGISWSVGSVPKIQWTSTGTFTPVELHYSRYGTFGAGDVFVVKPSSTVTNCTPQVGQITCNGEANFEIEDQISAGAKVRIRGTGSEADVQYISTNAFKIVGALDITAPESGQTWYVGELNKNITWDASGTIPNVNIGYKTSFAGGCNYTNIVSGDGGHTSGSNTYVWPSVADERTETAYICIQDVAFPEIVNVSAAPFKIRPQITVTTPTSGTRVKVGSDNPNLIKFSVTGTKTQLVDILCSLNSGTDGYPNTIQSDVNVALGPAGISWNDVDDTITSAAKIKVVDKASAGEVVFGLSPGTFKIVGGITLTVPPETPPAEKIMLKKGQDYLIQWDTTGTLDKLSIWYSVNDGAFNNPITGEVSAGLKLYNWQNVSGVTTSPNVKVKIIDNADVDNYAISAPIAIQSIMDLTAPENGVGWAVGETQYIEWTTLGKTAKVKLEVSTDGGIAGNGTYSVIPGTDDDGGLSNSWDPDVVKTTSYPWQIPNMIGGQNAIGTTVRVRVVDMADPDNWNESSSNFYIRANYVILSPNGNADPGLTEQLTVGSSVPIRWSVDGIVDTMRLEYSSAGNVDGSYATITTPTTATGIDADEGEPGCVPAPCWNWEIPNDISSDVFIRIIDEDHPTSTRDTSDYKFTIQGQLAFVPALPLAADNGKWYVGDTKTITWTKTGTIPLVKLQYSKVSDSTGPWIDIDTDLGVTTYPWVIPEDLSGTNPIDPSVWIRAINMNAAKPTIAAVSGQIDLRGKFTIGSPIVTDKWEVDSSHSIGWTPYGTMGTIKLEYSTNNFVTPLAVTGPAGEQATNLAAGVHEVPQSFIWKLPPNISNNVKVRISTNTVGQADVTDSPVFKIVGGYKLLTPNGGPAQYFEVDGSTPITWERHGAITNAKLQYSTNGFSNEDEVFDIITVPGTDGSYSWTIPAETDPGQPGSVSTIGTHVKVRISDPLYDGATVHTNSDVSDAEFEIRGKIDIDFPVGGEEFLITDNKTVSWTKHGSMPAVKVEYDSDPADAFDFTDPATGLPNYIKTAAGVPASSVAGTSYVWRIPDRKSLNKTRIKVTNLSDPNNVFTITPFFTIRGGFNWTNPVTTDQVFEVASTGVLTWSTFGTISVIDLQYSINNDFSYNPMLVNNNPGTPATAILNENTFNWIVPNAISKNVFLKIKDSSDPDAVAKTVKVKIAGKIYIDQPDSTQRWGVGTTKDITWHMDGSIANLKIEYFNGTVWVDPPISPSIVGSTGTKAWLIPPTVTPAARIRISDLITDSGTTPAVTDPFKIVGSFAFSAPANGDTWYVTTGGIANPTRNIVWVTQGVVPSVNLRYSKTGVAPWTLINTEGVIADGGNGGSYPWTVPDAISSTVKILIEDSADNETNQPSPQFTIAGDFQITSPAGAADKWGVNSIKNITWLKNGTDWSDDSVKKNMVYLFYSTDSTNGPWVPILNPLRGDYYVSNTGLFAWTIPDDISPNSRIQIQNVDGPIVTRNSPANFKIMARFDVTAPDGGETVMAGPNYTITWNKWGTGVNNVKIDLALNGNDPNPTFDKVISENTANDGSHPWPVSVDHVTPTAKIRIYDVNDIDTANVSATSFIIRATFTMDPNIGSVPLEVGETYNVFWTKQGNIPNVKLTYSPDNFFSDKRVIEPTADGIVPNVDSCTSNPTMGCYAWTVPDIEDNKDVGVKLKVADPNDLDAEAISNPFNIIPKFTITFPNGNASAALTDKLKVGTPYAITWNSSSSQAKTPTVTIAYTTTGGAPYNKTITTTENDGTYDWITGNGGVPDDISNQVKIRVTDASDGVAMDSSDFNVKIISDFTVSAPNGNATYEVGDPFTIVWTNKGLVPTVELAYGTNGDDFSAPQVFAGAYDNGNDYGSSYGWTIPNAIGTNVRVRVRSISDDGFGISGANFRIRGKLVAELPDDQTKAPIGQNYTIQWKSYGTIPTVKIHYDTLNGTGGYPNEITPSASNCTPVAPQTPCTSTFLWNNIPDTPATQAKIRIMDTRANENDVLTYTAPFQIVGNVTVVAPNDGEDWRVDSHKNITWTWGGSIPVIKLYYTKEPGDPEIVNWIEIDPLVVKDYSADGLQQNGANNTIQRNYNWKVVDDISPNVRIKVADATNPDVYDVSDDVFMIRGFLTLISPVGNPDPDLTERWVTSIFTTGEGHNIIWQANGTMPFVKLEYSNDNFADPLKTHEIHANAPNCVPNAGQACTGTFYWEIPDDVLKDQGGKYTGPNFVKVRISDVNDDEVVDESGDPFKIDYYQVKWIIRDLGTYNLMSDLTISEVKSTNPDFAIWQESGLAAQRPDPGGYTRIQPTPAGVWAATWSKTGYGDMLQLASLSKNNPLQDPPLALDPSYMLLMETTAVHIYISESRFTYDPETDRLDVVAWLSRDGSLMTGTVNAQILMYKGVDLVTGGPIILNKVGTDTGFFGTTLNNVTDENGAYKLQTGITYVVKAQTQIASQVPNNIWYQTPASFEITTPFKLQEVYDKVNEMLDKPLSEVDAALQASLAAQTGLIVATLATQTQTIATKLEEQKQAIDATLQSFTASVQSSLVALEAGARQSLAAGEQLKATAERFSWKTSATPNPALTNDTVVIQAQGLPGLHPVLSVYNYENKQIIASGAMDESKENPGNYYFSFKPDPGLFQAGKAYTFVVSEDTTGGLVGGSGFIESTSLTTIAGLVASAPGAETAAKKALDAIKGIEAAMTKGGDIAGVKDGLLALKDIVVELPNQIKELAKGDTGIKDVTQVVNSISSQLTSLAGTEGYDFSQLMSKAISEAPSVKDLRRKSDAIMTGVDIVQKTIEAKLGGSDEPIIAVSYTSGSVIVRVVVVNPSDTKSQEVPVKVYLPQETKPDDVMDKGDLEFGFDEVKSIYFVYKDKVTLQPKETRVFEVELKDIWFIPEETLNGLKVQTDKIMERLKETPYFDQAKIVADTIYGRLDRVATSQADESVNKELHIGLYRANLIVVAKVKEDIAKLEKMMVAVGAPPAPEMLAESKLNLKTPSRATTWFVIFAIMIFIGLLGFVFFITWQAQVKGSSGPPEDQDGTTSSKTDENSGQPPPDAT
ncbi:MAG: hypothetical protein ABH891_06685 [Candidatus Omnitrophota bacterium]